MALFVEVDSVEKECKVIINLDEVFNSFEKLLGCIIFATWWYSKSKK